MNQLFEERREDLLKKAERKNINKMRSIDFWPGGIELNMNTGERSGEICWSVEPELANFTGLRVRFEENTDLKEVVAGLKAICSLVETEVEEKNRLKKEPVRVCDYCGKVVRQSELTSLSYIHRFAHSDFSLNHGFPEYSNMCEECFIKADIFSNPGDLRTKNSRDFENAREEAKNWHESVKSFIDKAEAEWKSYEESGEPEKAKSKNNADFEMC